MHPPASKSAPVAEHNDVLADRARGRRDRVDFAHAVVERDRGSGADRASRGNAHMSDDDVCTRLRHRDRFFLVKDIGCRQEVEPVGLGDHVHLDTIAHPGLLEPPPHPSIEEADGGEVLYAGKAHGLQFREKLGHENEWVGAIDAGEYRCSLHDRQHL